MRTTCNVLAAVVLALTSSRVSFGQTATTSQSVPRVINISGVFQPADGQPPPAGTVVTLSIYPDPQGGTLLWQETQNIVLDKAGRFTLLLGASQPDGLPLEIFASGDARWLGMQFAGLGEVERPRTQITSVPYALRASDADTLGGKPASAYLLAPTAPTGAGHAAGAAAGAATTSSSNLQSPPPTTQALLPGTTNFLAKYVNSADVGTSAVFENNGLVGIGTTTPFDVFHVRYTNTNGGMTGYAVQNLGNTATSYSGMLFYDQNGALGQFQGFNNVTHEYRINNIARNGASQFDGSINFMIGSTSRFLVTAPGNIGIGTTAPNALLDVSNALIPTSGIANISVTSYSTFPGSEFIGRKARGTAAVPANAQNGDTLAFFGGRGYGTTGFGPFSSGMEVATAQSWTDTAQATMLNFTTTAAGSTSPSLRMSIASNGNVGIGTGSLGGVAVAAANLEVSNGNNAAPFGTILGSSFTGTNPAGTLFVGRKARGTLAAPTAVQGGDNLVGFLGEGYGATGFSLTRGGMFVQAAENFTDTAQGTRLNFNTTATGTNTPGTKMTIDPAGNVGIGTLAPSAPLEVSRTGTNAGVVSTLYANGADAGSFLVAQTARGSEAVPTAVQAGDFLGALLISGYATTRFQEAAAVGAAAAENFTDTARGTVLLFATTPLGGSDSVLGMALLPSGNVGIGTPLDVNGLPTATDKLQIFGDARVGNGTTNGCLKRFDGTGLAGTCASDRRFKKNITPFGPVLNQFTALQPVHYYWRAAEFPDRHFGDAQAYGLIAQDVEQVLPELVVTNDDGFKAIDYSKLPLLTIQAVKELKAENDALKAQNDALRDRVAEIERLIREMRTTATNR